MENFKKNLNKLNGLTIRQSDMTFQLKNQITQIISKALKMNDVNQQKLSKAVTQYMNTKYPEGWVCLVGKKFIANISHQPKFQLFNLQIRMKHGKIKSHSSF